MPARSLTCHTRRYNRNVRVPPTLERQSVNVLTCEFPHRIQGVRKRRRVPWGEKEGGDGEPDRPGRPTQREQHNQQENNPPTRTQPTEPATTEHPQQPHGRTRSTNENLSHDPRLRTTRPEHNQQDKPPTRPAHPLRKELQPTRTHRRTATPPNRGTTRTKNHSTPSGRRGEQGRGLRGADLPTSHHPPPRRPGPTSRTPPPTRHPNPTRKPDPIQKPDPRTRTPTTLQPPHHPHPTRYPAHMPWTTSNRRQRLPTNWNKLRKQVLAKANYKCAGLDPVTTPPPTTREAQGGAHRWHHPACTMRATDVDHIIAGDNHELSNLQALSHACHTAKTTHENAAAKARIRATATREQPPHPCARATQTNKKEKQNKTKTKTNKSETRSETTRRETWN